VEIQGQGGAENEDKNSRRRSLLLCHCDGNCQLRSAVPAGLSVENVRSSNIVLSPHGEADAARNDALL
jgi:hypothetical protein